MLLRSWLCSHPAHTKRTDGLVVGKVLRSVGGVRMNAQRSDLEF